MRASEPKKAIVRKTYDRPYRLAMWQRCRAICLKKKVSARRFFDDEILPAIEPNIAQIGSDFDPNFHFTYPSMGSDPKIVRDFLSIGDTDRKFGLNVLQMFDAYVQIVTPKFAQLTNAKDDLDKMGEIVGHFLRDPRIEEMGYLLAQASQKLLHFFSYDNVDTLGSYDDTQRFLCLFVGDTPDYLFALDFAFRDEDIVPLYDEKLRLFYGFCAPGEDFSPLIMRSHCLKERLAGLVYTKSSLIDLSSPTLNELTFEVFTTDKAFHGNPSGSVSDQEELSENIRKALVTIKGMKIGRQLQRVDQYSNIHQKLKSRVSKFIIEFL